MMGLIFASLACEVELDDAVQGAVVGDGQAVHPQLLGAGQQLGYTAHAVKQAVLGVDVQVCEHGNAYQKAGKPETIIPSWAGLPGRGPRLPGRAVRR